MRKVGFISELHVIQQPSTAAVPIILLAICRGKARERILDVLFHSGLRSSRTAEIVAVVHAHCTDQNLNKGMGMKSLR